MQPWHHEEGHLHRTGKVRSGYHQVRGCFTNERLPVTWPKISTTAIHNKPLLRLLSASWSKILIIFKYNHKCLSTNAFLYLSRTTLVVVMESASLSGRTPTGTCWPLLLARNSRRIWNKITRSCMLSSTHATILSWTLHRFLNNKNNIWPNKNSTIAFRKCFIWFENHFNICEK